ncbi:hypothetical protein L3049_18765 [Labilibaculum sp. DW002]|uniref:OmpR/PhoB-type domain-containing protein n=1 Tax=Paralabilibaculum antarcticum TaxID=2912572 RepID=A0ABT5VX96_9BACT|nr:hypothetical protein [Labilibaculum sp. DW002]MDE5420037.1 hypothetical protein [Labilibaculum sp. DW002]
MINKNEEKSIEEALNRICSHKLFVNSPTNSSLLKYLVEKAIAKEEINEITIGSELYGIDYSENKSNSTVRSYMYKLRNKLADYYADAGAKESLLFEISKGQCNLSFLSPTEYHKSRGEKGNTVTIPIKYIKVVSGVLLLTILSFFLVKTIADKPNFVWASYFEANSDNLLVVSDQFVVGETFPDGKERAVLYHEVNNNNDFIKYSQQHPEKSIQLTDYTLMSKMAPYTVNALSKWFTENDSSFDLKLESKLSYDDARNHNILFVGQYKTMNLSKSLFLKDSKVFATFNDGFKYNNGSVAKVYNTRFGENQKVEYAMVSFNPLSNGKNALYFVSNNDIGVMATVRKFTDEKWLKEFAKQLPDESIHFNALFEVSGLQRTDVSCELVELEVLK